MKKFESWKTLNSEVFKQTPWVAFRENKFKMPSGKEGTYWFVDSKGSSFIVPITSEGKIILTNQYRYLIDQSSLEFPGGGIADNEDYEENAKKELEEETGYKALSMVYVGEFVPMNGVTNEFCKVYIAKGLKKGERKLEETEEGMEVLEVSVEELEELIKNNIIKDGMTLASWELAKHHI